MMEKSTSPMAKKLVVAIPLLPIPDLSPLQTNARD